MGSYIYECVCYYNRCHGNDVKVFWDLQDIFMTMCKTTLESKLLEHTQQ
jgi:hypothetical protein